MKKIIALIISIITISIGVYSQVDDLNTAVEVINVAAPAVNGDYQAATTNVVEFRNGLCYWRSLFCHCNDVCDRFHWNSQKSII